MRWSISLAAFAVAMPVLADPPAPPGITPSAPLPRSVSGLPTPTLTVIFPDMSIGVMRVAQALVGSRRTTARVPSTDACQPPPRDATAGADGRWGLSVSVTPRAGKPLARVRVCRLRTGAGSTCFLDVPLTGAAASARFSRDFLPVPEEPPPDPAGAALPRLKYQLVADLRGGQVFQQDLELKLAPLPVVSMSGAARSKGYPFNEPNHTQQAFAPVSYSNVAELGILWLHTGTAVGQPMFIENAASVRDGTPSRVHRVYPEIVSRRTQICDMRMFPADAISVWHRDPKLSVWARSPLIEGCQFTIYTDTVPAPYTEVPRPSGVPFPPESCPILTPIRPGSSSVAWVGSIRIDTSSGSSSGSSSGAACREGTPCTPPADATSGCQTGFTPTGITRCTRGMPICEAQICRTCGGNCGGCGWSSAITSEYPDGDRCSLASSAGWCAPGAICGWARPGDCDTRTDPPCGRCRPNNACTPPPACWAPMLADGTWPGRRGEDACGSSAGGSSCTGSCTGNCGWDGCAGSCGNCATGQSCLGSITGAAGGGQCAPNRCRAGHDEDCCPPTDPKCGTVTRRVCNPGGFCTG